MDKDKTYGLMAVVGGQTPQTEKNEEKLVSSWKLLEKISVCGLVIFLVILIISMLFNAPLEEFANPEVTPNPAKAPWYFLGLQEMVHYSALWGGIIIPAIIGEILMMLPYAETNRKTRKVALILFTLFVIGTVTLIITGTFFRGPNWSWVVPWR